MNKLDSNSSRLSDQRQKIYWEKDMGHRSFDHPVVECFAEQRISFIETFFPLSQIDSVLDIGCGQGFSNHYFSKRIPKTIGLDRSNRLLRQNPRKKEGSLVQGDVFKLPFTSSSYDLVVAWETLHHVSTPGKVVAEMKRVTRKYILIAEPNPWNPLQFLFAIFDPEHRWVLRYSKNYLKSLLWNNGIEVQFCETGGWIFPNKTPLFFVNILKRMPYVHPLGISNWILGKKK